MRSQSNELLRIAKQLRDYLDTLDIEVDGNAGENITVSSNVRVHYNPKHNYMSVDMSKWPNTVNLSLFEHDDYSNNTVTINVETISDEDLDNVILLFSEDVSTFIGLKLYEKNVPAN